jgi:DNA-binding NtrC family response regulator
MRYTTAPVCVVDDDTSVREAVGSLIRSAGLKVRTFMSAREFLASPRAEASCLILDAQLPGLNGLDLQQELAKADVQIPIIFLSGHGDIPMTVRAIKAGALEFLTRPFDDEALLNAIRQGIARSHAARQQRPELARHDCAGIIGVSAVLRAVLNQVEVVAPTESTVLILGETGMGKELIARAIHNRSKRSKRAFVSVNCAAIPPALIASELFGHEKGAFTGTPQRRLGRFELADGGTIFLDEIGDLPAETQGVLLRVLQEKQFERVGGNEAIRADVRLIAATNRDLQAAMAAGTFRSDLFYRLNMFHIDMPPLRERKEDIPFGAEYFIDRYANKEGSWLWFPCEFLVRFQR